MKKLTVLPEGTEDILFEKCISKRAIENKLENVFVEGGFSEIITPSFEYYDVFNIGKLEAFENAYKFTGSTNRLMSLRTDSTAPIARAISARFKNNNTEIKLYYKQNVFRANASYSGKMNETTQCGVECIGKTGVDNDVYVITLAINALKEVIGNDFKLEISHAGIFNSLIKQSGLSDDDVKTVSEYIASKNIPALNNFNFSDENKKIFTMLPMLFGGNDVLNTAKNLFGDNYSEANSHITYLNEIYSKLSEQNLHEYIMFDLGLVSDFDYYTGIIFRAYTGGCGHCVLSGGRYDTLLSKFGKDAPALGFAIDADAVLNNKESYLSNDKPIRIALTKGRLEKDTLALFEKSGISSEELKNKGRKLMLTTDDKKIEILIAKANDVITYVEHGVCDLGFVGRDTIMEHDCNFYEIADLGFGKCRFALAGKKGKDIYSGFDKKVIATKYPSVAKNFFADKGLDIEIIKIDGSVEVAPILELADAIVDLVETGSTLKANGLEVYEDICDISARIIANPASIKLKKSKVTEFLDRVKI